MDAPNTVLHHFFAPVHTRLMATLLLVVLADNLSAIQDARVLKEEIKKFDGTWIVVSLKIEGKESANPKDKEMQVIFRDGKAIHLKPEKPFRLDPSRKPKQIDMDNGADGTMNGIYALDGDMLTICVPSPFLRGKRPTTFESDAAGM